MRFQILVAAMVALAAAPGSQAQTDAATVDFDDQTSQGTVVVVSSAALSDGGFITIHDETLLDGDALGSVVGVSKFLAVGVHLDIPIELSGVPAGNATLIAMPHFDTNGNEAYDFVTSQGMEDGPYTENGEAVVDDADVFVTASVVFNDQDSDGGSAVVDEVSLPEGGFVTIHDDSLLDGDALESVRGTSAFLAAGNHSHVTIEIDGDLSGHVTLIAMPHLDSDGDQAYDFVSSQGEDDGPYTDGSVAITDEATISIEAPSDDAMGGDADPGDGAADDGDGEGGSRGMPGFGLAALLAALATIVLARRR